MASDDYVFDPDGDLILILTKQHEVLQEEPSRQEVLGNVAVPAGVVEQPEEYGEVYMEPSFNDNITPEMVVNPSFSPLSEKHLTWENSEPEDVDTRSATETEPEDIHMQVSSKHLILASSVFAKMLNGKFREAENMRLAGHVAMRLPDDDPAAFSVLLNIAHGRTRRVPRRVGLTMLTEIARLVDKYYMHEVIEIYSDRWIDDIKDDVPRSFTNDLLPWLCISWVFQKADIFKRTTSIAQHESKRVIGEGKANALPIPSSIIDAIENSRRVAIWCIVSALEELRADYESPEPQCTRSDDRAFHCDALALGSLRKESLRLRLLPTPNAPYQGFSYDNLAQEVNTSTYLFERGMFLLADRSSYYQVKTMKTKTLCELHGAGYNHYGYGHKQRTCTIGPKIVTSIDSLNDQLDGLDLADFKARSKKPRS